MDALVKMGFTELEGDVYVHLLQHSPATGYAVAKALGRSNANTYKAIASLQRKGAVLVDRGRSRLCRAVPAAELFDQLERSFAATRREAEARLDRLRPSPGDDGIYHLVSFEQVFERCRGMLAACEHSAVLDLFPGPLAYLAGDIGAAAARGRRVTLQVYEPTEIPGVPVILHGDAATTTSHWPAEWMALIVDGAQYLTGVVDTAAGRVHQAVWSASPVIAWAYHSYARSEQMLSRIRNLVADGGTLEQVAEICAEGARHVETERPPGYRLLLERFGLADGDDSPPRSTEGVDA